MTNEVSITVSITDDTEAGSEEVIARAETTGREAGAALTSGLQEAAGGGVQERVSALLAEGRDAEAQALMNQAPSVVEGGGAGDALAREMTAGGEKAVLAARSTAEQMSSVFQEIYQKGANAGFLLTQALTASWAGIEAETKGLTQTEKAIFTEFNQILAAEGQDAAVAFATGQRQAAQSTAETAQASAQGAEALGSLAQAAQGAGTEMVFLSEQARAAYEEQQRLWAAERDGIEQFALFEEQDAPGMFTRIAATAQESAAGVQELEGALAQAAGQLELFTAKELQWVETTNMAQRPLSGSLQANWGSGIQVENTPFAYSSPEAAANAEKVKASLAGQAEEARKAEGAFGGLAGVMNGPLMQAFYGISTVAFLPQALAQGAQMITGLFSNAAVSASAFTQAVSQDSNAIGDNTAATIQNTLAKTSLDDLSKQLGVSQATLIEYAAGESSAQADVTAAYQAKQTALGHASDAEGVHSRAQEETGNSADRLSGALAAQKSLLDQVTASVQQAIGQDKAQSDALLAAERTNEIYNASVGALVSQMKLQAEQANMNADATLRYQQTLGPGTQAYTDMVRNQTVTLEQNAVSAQLNAVAMNEMIPVQGELSKAALGAAVDYQQAATATGLYTQALTALYGQYGATSDAQAQFTTAMANVATQVTKGKDAVDLSTDAGAKNYQAFYTAAQAAEGYAEKLYQQTGNARTADAALQDMASTLDKAALKAGLTKDQVHELNVELFGVPDVKDITIAVSTSEAYRQVGNLVQWIDQQTGTVDLTVNQFGVGITGSGARFMASGGISGAASGGVRGNLVEVGEQGRELVRMPVGASVVPNANVNAMAAGAYGGWDGKITIEFAGSDGDPLWEALRHHIRARAGNGPNSVQVALGQSY